MIHKIKYLFLRSFICRHKALVAQHWKCIICMEHTAKGSPKILEKCRLPLTASRCVNKIITEMCVLEVTPDGLLMTEINPEFTVEDVKAATAAPFAVAENLKSMID